MGLIDKMVAISLEKKVFKGASWLAFFKFMSQIFSWVVTIWVARILSPEDYGLMTMATMITGYALIFNELGLGKAIIQRPNINNNELSSIFWFSFFISLLLGASCFVIAYPTAYIFDEPKVVAVTQVASLIFITSGLQIVPINLLKKQLLFKKVGLIELITVIISTSSMLIIAKLGGGVWALIGGLVIMGITRVMLLYFIVGWFPLFHFSFSEAKEYLKFGIIVSLTKSLSYVYEKSDKFFAGRAWTSTALGHYSMALELAQVPTEKIVVLINQVSFPAFSNLQYDKERFNKFYLSIVKITSILVLPIFVGAFLVGEEIIMALLNEKWFSIIFIFKYLALSQIITALNSVNNVVHISQGRPKWSFWFNAVRAVVMSVSFAIAARYGLNAMLIPWFTVYVLLCTIWIVVTNKKIGLNMNDYLGSLKSAMMATGVMILGVLGIDSLIDLFLLSDMNLIIMVLFKVLVGAFFYIGYIWFFDRDMIKAIKNIKN